MTGVFQKRQMQANNRILRFTKQNVKFAKSRGVALIL